MKVSDGSRGWDKGRMRLAVSVLMSLLLFAQGMSPVALGEMYSELEAMSVASATEGDVGEHTVTRSSTNEPLREYVAERGELPAADEVTFDSEAYVPMEIANQSDDLFYVQDSTQLVLHA